MILEPKLRVSHANLITPIVCYRLLNGKTINCCPYEAYFSHTSHRTGAKKKIPYHSRKKITMLTALDKVIRLNSIHKRVVQISERDNFLLWEKITPKLCKFCQKKLVRECDFKGKKITESNEKSYINKCTEVEWLCAMLEQLYGPLPPWTNVELHEELWTSDMYTGILKQIQQEFIPERSLLLLDNLMLK